MKTTTQKTVYSFTLPSGLTLTTSDEESGAWIERLQKDAERYRWLRTESSDLSLLFTIDRHGKPLGIKAKETMDAAIDAAITQEGKSTANAPAPTRPTPPAKA